MSLWYFLVVFVMSDGTVLSDIRYPLSPDYNGKEICEQAGQQLLLQEQESIGDKGKVYFDCKEITLDEMKKALIKVKGQDT